DDLGRRRQSDHRHLGPDAVAHGAHRRHVRRGKCHHQVPPPGPPLGARLGRVPRVLPAGLRLGRAGPSKRVYCLYFFSISSTLFLLKPETPTISPAVVTTAPRI